jgi:pimeloyl-ACP methyl ester carboxylesterase
MAMDMRAGARTFWQTFGSGPRASVALHCSLAHSGAWAAVAERLAGRITMTAFDLPGHGQSADWDGTEDFTALCARIAEGFVGVGAGEAVDLIGHSGGAVAALQLALAAPERVRTLTLIEPVLFAAARGTEAGRNHAAAMAPVFDLIAAGEREAAAERFVGIWGTGKPWDRIDPRQRAYFADRIHLIEAGMPALAEDNGAVLAPGRLESLTMPVMLISGAASPPVIHAIAEAIAARLPDVGVAEVPGAGHMLPVTHPDQTAGLIAANLDRA